MNNIQFLAAQAAVKKLFQQTYFDITTIDNINRASGNIPKDESYKTLRMLHCVSYSDMDKELIKELPNLVKEAIGGTALDTKHVFDVLDVIEVVDVVTKSQPAPRLGLTNILKSIGFSAKK